MEIDGPQPKLPKSAMKKSRTHTTRMKPAHSAKKANRPMRSTKDLIDMMKRDYSGNAMKGADFSGDHPKLQADFGNLVERVMFTRGSDESVKFERYKSHLEACEKKKKIVLEVSDTEVFLGHVLSNISKKKKRSYVDRVRKGGIEDAPH